MTPVQHNAMGTAICVHHREIEKYRIYEQCVQQETTTDFVSSIDFVDLPYMKYGVVFQCKQCKKKFN